jgi:hypothetical protein
MSEKRSNTMTGYVRRQDCHRLRLRNDGTYVPHGYGITSRMGTTRDDSL